MSLNVITEDGLTFRSFTFVDSQGKIETGIEIGIIHPGSPHSTCMT